MSKKTQDKAVPVEVPVEEPIKAGPAEEKVACEIITLAKPGRFYGIDCEAGDRVKIYSRQRKWLTQQGLIAGESPDSDDAQDTTDTPAKQS